MTTQFAVIGLWTTLLLLLSTAAVSGTNAQSCTTYAVLPVAAVNATATPRNAAAWAAANWSAQIGRYFNVLASRVSASALNNPCPSSWQPRISSAVPNCSQSAGGYTCACVQLTIVDSGLQPIANSALFPYVEYSACEVAYFLANLPSDTMSALFPMVAAFVSDGATEPGWETEMNTIVSPAAVMYDAQYSYHATWQAAPVVAAAAWATSQASGGASTTITPGLALIAAEQASITSSFDSPTALSAAAVASSIIVAPTATSWPSTAASTGVNVSVTAVGFPATALCGGVASTAAAWQSFATGPFRLQCIALASAMTAPQAAAATTSGVRITAPLSLNSGSKAVVLPPPDANGTMYTTPPVLNAAWQQLLAAMGPGANGSVYLADWQVASNATSLLITTANATLAAWLASAAQAAMTAAGKAPLDGARVAVALIVTLLIVVFGALAIAARRASAQSNAALHNLSAPMMAADGADVSMTAFH